MMWGYEFGSTVGPLIMGISVVLFWVLVLAVVVAVFRWIRTGHGPRTEPGRSAPDDLPDARHVLDGRFASGEIDGEEYAARRRVLLERD
jgi:putative membrane protein